MYDYDDEELEDPFDESESSQELNRLGKELGKKLGKELGKKLLEGGKKLLLTLAKSPVFWIVLAIVLLFTFIISLFMGSEASFADGAEHSEENGKIQVVGNPEDFWYDPQNVLDNLDTLNKDIDDAGNIGHSYLTDSDLKVILNAIINYRKLVRKDITRTYEYYYHNYSWSENENYDPDATADEIDTGEKTTVQYTITDEEDKKKRADCVNSSIEDDPLFSVTWEEIYAIMTMSSVEKDGYEDYWEDDFLDAEGGTRTKKTVAKARIDANTLAELINNFTYKFGYYFDPTASSWNGHIFSYDEMEEHAYIRVISGTNVEHGTEVAGTTEPFTYTDQKIPAVAPAVAQNCYQKVVYLYEGNVLKGREITVDGQAFVDYLETVLGEENFDFDWFMDKLRLLPGVTHDDGYGSMMDRYERIYQSYKNGAPEIFYDYNIPGAGSVTLGSSCPRDVIPYQQIIMTNSANQVTGVNQIVYEANWSGGRAEFIDIIGNLAIKLWNEYGILPSLTIAQAALESGWGNSAPGNMLFGIKAGSSWAGKTQLLWTHENINGVSVKVQDTFRAYDSWEESIIDHAKLLNAPRYTAVQGNTDYVSACYEVKAAGYATDPLYAQKLIGMIEAYGLDKYDKMIGNPNYGRN